MKKISLFLIAATALIGGLVSLAARNQKSVPRTVQGIDYRSTLTDKSESPSRIGDYPDDPDDLSVPEGEFSFDDIVNWTGEGANKAALVIQWNDDKEQNALVFGYRWDGQATGADMIRAVVANNPRLYGLIQYTNVSSPTDPNGGYTINGFGWDYDDDGDIALIDTGHSDAEYETEDGLFIHPRGYNPEVGGSSDYDYDNWKARDTDDFWGAGWYISYWSYWVKEGDAASFAYSSWGASGRVLQDGSWDGWNFSIGMIARDWKNFTPAPNAIPDGAKTLFKSDGVYYTLQSYQSKTVVVTAPVEMEGETLTAYSGDIEIPSTFEDEGITYNVVAIGDNAFKNSAVTSVTLPESVKKIGKNSFDGSTLATLGIRTADGVVTQGVNRFDNITSLGVAAFANCSAFADVFFPSSITTVAASLFENTKVASVEFPEYIESVGESTFAGCVALTDVTVPATLKTIGDKAFADCTALATVKAASTRPAAASAETFANCPETAVLNVPMGYEETYRNATGWSAFAHIEPYKIAVNVGDKFVMGGVSYLVTELGDKGNTVKATYMPFDGKFSRDNVKAANAAYTGDITVPSATSYQGLDFKVTELGDSTFYSAVNVTSVKLPEGIDHLWAYTFNGASSLTAVSIPSTVTSIGKYCFSDCAKLAEINLPEAVTEIGERAFNYCGAITEIVVPANVKSIGENAFYACKSLVSATLPDGLENMAGRVFNTCTALTTVKLPSGLTKIPDYTFYSCQALKSLEIPSTVTEIGNSAFSGCYALEMDIPAGITKLGTSVFQNCRALVNVTVPEAITVIPQSTFQSCTGLESVTMSQNVTNIDSRAFSGCTALKAINCPGAQTEASVEREASEGCRLVLPAKLKSIGDYSFANCKNFTEIKFNDELTTIGSNSFSGLSNLTEIDIPESCTNIGGRAFENCGISQFVIPAAAKTLGAYIAKGSNVNDVTFYICGNSPSMYNCGSYSFATKDYKTFAPLVVPTGSKSAFEAANNWKKSEISAPEVTGFSVSEASMTLTGNTEKLSVPFAFAYDIDNLPERFAKANDAIVAANENVTFTLTYSAEGAEEQTASLTLSDGTLQSGALTLTPGVTYTGNVTAKVNDTDYTSEELSFESAVKYVSAINIDGVEGDVITLNPKHLLGIKCTVYPEDAANKNYTVTLQNDKREDGKPVASLYNVMLWENGSTRPNRVPELSGHYAGECKLIVKASDNSGYVHEYTVKVVEQDRTPLAENTYLDGTIILNEEWFGHTNGGLNFITKDGNIMYQAYERENPGMSFGCTSQYGIIWSDRLIVASKQAADGGDPLPGGGRLVVADAKTLKRQGSIDDLIVEGETKSGDGRAVVGATPSKVYVGTNNGIYIVDLDNVAVTGKVAQEGDGNTDLYNGQIGDMVNAGGRYVFGIKQATGVFVIDTETDQIVKTIDDANVQGITQSSDGNVWYATLEGKASKFVCINPATLETEDDMAVVMPESIGTVTCGWGAWRTTQFFGSQSENVLWFSPGSSISNGGAGNFYRWEIGSDPTDIQPVFSLNDPKLPGVNEGLYQSTYGTSRYDDRSGELIVMTTELKASGHYRYNWTHFIDPATGQIKRTIELDPYYWFQAVPIFPDKYNPALHEDFDKIIVRLDKNPSEEDITFDLSEIVGDPDNIDFNITYALTPATAEEMDAPSIAEASLEGSKLRLKPLAKGETNILVDTRSNGRVSTLSIPVMVQDPTGVDGIGDEDRSIKVENNRVFINGYRDSLFTLFDMSGNAIVSFTPDSDSYVAGFDCQPGIYVLSGNGVAVKILFK